MCTTWSILAPCMMVIHSLTPRGWVWCMMVERKSKVATFLPWSKMNKSICSILKVPSGAIRFQWHARLPSIWPPRVSLTIDSIHFPHISHFNGDSLIHKLSLILFHQVIVIRFFTITICRYSFRTTFLLRLLQYPLSVCMPCDTTNWHPNHRYWVFLVAIRSNPPQRIRWSRAVVVACTTSYCLSSSDLSCPQGWAIKVAQTANERY